MREREVYMLYEMNKESNIVIETPVLQCMRCRMFVTCVHPVAVLNAVFCMTCSLLMLAGRGCKKRPYGRGILQSQSHDCLIGRHGCLLLFTPSCCCECFLLSFVEACVFVLRCCECVCCM